LWVTEFSMLSYDGHVQFSCMTNMEIPL
jgi:hypothetical protein